MTAVRSLAVLASLLCLFVGAPSFAQTGGLNGPSSTAADLEPGDGLTDPQFRSTFPRDIAPGWFAWKEGLADQGFRFGLDYFALGMTSTSDLGQGEASGGVAKFYGTWQATETGSLTFKLEHRHAFTPVAPLLLGMDGGAVSINSGFNDKGTQLVNLFWTQRASDGSWTLQLGQIDASDFLDIYGLVSPWTSFQNFAFNTNPAIFVPEAGLGVAGGVKLGGNFYMIGSLVDANADQSDPNFEVFDKGELFKSVEIGYTSGFDRIYFDNIHLTLWHVDAAADGSRAEDYGGAFSAAWFIDNTWMPFVRAGWSKGTATLYERSISTGIGYFGRNTDLAGLGLNWANVPGSAETQLTSELFYRFSISPGLQITPSVQYVRNPLRSAQNSFAMFGLRARVSF